MLENLLELRTSVSMDSERQIKDHRLGLAVVKVYRADSAVKKVWLAISRNPSVVS